MKKFCSAFISVLFVFISFFSFCPNVFALQSEDIEKTQIGNSDTFYEYISSTKTLIISGSGAVPDFGSSGSSQPWYDWRSDGSVEKIEVKDGITTLGAYCFYNVKANEVTLPKTLKIIKQYAFAYCTKLKNVSLPFGLTTINSYAFLSCSKLEEVNLPDTLTVIGSNAFDYCVLLDNVVIPYSVSTIGNFAFYRCRALKNLTFDSLTKTVNIGSYAFADCDELKSVAVPEGASLSSGSFGYSYVENEQIEGFSMQVFSATSAEIYAVSNSISHTVIDTFSLSLGVKNYSSYTAENNARVKTFTFTPTDSEVYNFYSDGSCDLAAELYDESENKIAENDDISDTDMDFCISVYLTAGETYSLKVNSRLSIGDFYVTVYPDEIENFEVIGSLTKSALERTVVHGIKMFNITDEELEKFVLDISFSDGFSDKIYFKNEFFDNKTVTQYTTQTEKTFTCGENEAYVKIGNLSSPYTVNIEHSFDEEVVNYTAYEDGYTLYTCTLCGENYKGDFVKTPAITVSGRFVLNRGFDGDVIPYTFASFSYDSKTYTPDGDGYFSFNTLEDCEIEIENPYGENVSFSVDFDGGSVDLGEIELSGYDFNADGKVNGKDYGIFLFSFRDDLGDEYWSGAVNFM